MFLFQFNIIFEIFYLLCCFMKLKLETMLLSVHVYHYLNVEINVDNVPIRVWNAIVTCVSEEEHHSGITALFSF